MGAAVWFSACILWTQQFNHVTIFKSDHHKSPNSLAQSENKFTDIILKTQSTVETFNKIQGSTRANKLNIPNVWAKSKQNFNFMFSNFEK